MTPNVRVEGVGLISGWGEGVAALPDDARVAAAGREVIPLPTPPYTDERFRRATRECLLGIAATTAALRVCRLAREEIRGGDTALIYATAGAYGASNRTFIETAASGAVRFPYTAPSAVPAEVAIEFGLSGSYVILIGGATATLEALWQASVLIARGAARRVLVLAVETFTECADLYARGGRLLSRPLTEAAACAVLLPGREPAAWRPATDDRLEAMVKRRAGETLACEPLIALALGAGSGGFITVTGGWRGRRAGLGMATA